MSDLFNADEKKPRKKPRKKAAAPQTEAVVTTEAAVEGSTGTDLVAAGAALLPAVVFAKDGSVDVLKQLREKVLAEKTDISTPKGRAAVKSLVYRIQRTKTGLDAMGKDLGDNLREQLNPILEERRKIRDGCDALAEEVRAPLTAWEESEQKRVDAHEAALKAIDALAVFDVVDPTAAQIQERLEQLKALPDRDWGEFIQRAVETKKEIGGDLERFLQEAQAREETAAEIARMEAEAAAEEAEKQRLAREAELAAAAEEAKRLAEQAAAEEAERVAEETRLEAARVAEVAETERKRLADIATAEAAAKEEAERQLKEAQEKAEENRKAGHRRALESILGMAADAASPMNDSGMIKHVTTYFETMEELKRNFEEFQSEADQTITECRARIAERLKVVEEAEAERARKRAKDAEDEAARVRQAGIDEEKRRRDEAQEQERKAAEQRAQDEVRRKQVRDEIAAVIVNLANVNTISNAEEIADAIMLGQIPHTTVIY